MSQLDEHEKTQLPLAMGFLTNNFFEGNRHGLLGWVSRFLSESAQSKLRQLMFLEDPDRIEAETLLIDFLKSDPTRTISKNREASRLNRRTSWGKTFVSQLSGKANAYVNYTDERVPDHQLLSALFGIAYRWQQELKAFPDYKQRADALEHACRNARFKPLAINYDSNLAERLKQFTNGKRLAELIEKSQGVLWQKFDSERDGQLLTDLFRKDLDKKGDERNGDALLEMFALLALTRVFISLDWLPVKRNLIFNKDDKLEGGLNLSKDNFFLHIQKGFPDDVTDRTVGALKSSVCYSATGKQPDIVLHFFSEGSDRECYLIGDAKRNATGDGDSYRRAAFFSMLNDFVAFSHKLQLSFSSNEQEIFDAPIKPCGLLFFKQFDKCDQQSEKQESKLIESFGFGEYADFSPKDDSIVRLKGVISSIEQSVLEYLNSTVN